MVAVTNGRLDFGTWERIFQGQAEWLAPGVSTAGGGMYNHNSSPTLTNCILWGNTALYGTQIYNGGTSNPTVTYSDIQDGYPTGDGNINANPLFLRNPDPGPDGNWGTSDDDYGDLRLQLTSPAIDAGDNTAVPAGITTDLDGRPRFVDIPGVADTGEGAPPFVDMGACEAQLKLKVYLPLVLKSYGP